MFKKSKILLLVFTLLLLCTCETGIATKNGKRVLNIALFEGGLGKTYWKVIISKFEKAYPDIHVEATIDPHIGDIIRPKIISGNPPDLVDLSDTNPSNVLQSLIKEKALVDLSDVFEKNAYDQDIPLKNLIIEEFLTSKKFSPYGDGKIYVAPKYCGPVGLVYDKNLFKEMGWELPRTWSEFFSLGDKAAKEGIALLTYPGVYPYYLEHFLLASFASHAGKDNINNIFSYQPGSFSTPKMLEVMEQVERLSTHNYILQGSEAYNHIQAQEQMMIGRALFIPTGSWIESEMINAPRRKDFAYGMINGLSMHQDEEPFVYSNWGQIFIPKGAKNINDAKAFIRFFYSEESMVALAQYANAVEPIIDGKDIVKNYISPAQFEMFNLFDEATSIIPDYKLLPAKSKVDIYDLIYSKGASRVLSGKITAVQWAQNVEKGFRQIKAIPDW